MRNKATLAKFTAHTMLAAAFSMLTACGSQSDDPKKEAESVNDEKFDDRRAEKDAQFLVDAAEINYQEMELGELAQSNAMDPEVKKLGKMMKEEHVKLLGELKKLAENKGVALPEVVSHKGRKACDQLSKKSGRDFDKAYCDKMVEGHKDAISEFEDAARDVKDKEIREWAFSSLPALSRHLDHFVAYDKKHENGKRD